jgi:formylglycine-generating enzyme required for sulfatase activity
VKRLPVSGRADLLRELREGRLCATTAGLYRFEPLPESPAGTVPERVKPGAADPSLPEATPPPAPMPEFPRERPPLVLLRAVRMEPLAPLPPPPADDPVREDELKVPWGQAGVPLQPLIRWARLAGWLRQRLGRQMDGSALDLPRMLRGVARGEPVLGLPRRRRLVWSAQALVLWDETREMRPFQPDFQWLRDRLERERGKYGLQVVPLQECPQLRHMARLSPGCPVLALSAMGQFTGDPHVQNIWAAVGRRLLWQGHPLQALSPCPRWLWSRELARAWPLAVWDRGSRLPRPTGSPALPVPAPEPKEAVGELLDLLAPARRISPQLLRAARFCQPSRADAEVEWRAWFHEHGWNSFDCFGYRTGPDQAERLNRRATWTGPLAGAAGVVARLIESDHAAHGPTLLQETQLRLALASPGGGATPEAVAAFLRRVVDRLRQMIGTSRSTSRRTDHLPAWIHQMTDALTPEMRGHPSIRQPLAQCLALADELEPGAKSEVAPGMDLEAYTAEARAIPTRSPAWTAAWRLRLEGAGRGEPARMVLQSPSEAAASGKVPLASLTVGPGPLLVEGASLAARRFEIEPAHEGISLPLVDPPSLRISSRLERLTLEPFTRPAWARRVWQDRFGLAAEFAVGGVAFVLRWIPPGRFLMGSPEGEEGRRHNEGPQKEVTISRGFWMGETPVTQAQWRVVVSAANAVRGAAVRLKRAPSHFQGPSELPVEQVSWNDCQRFCELLDALLTNGPGFGLPKDAQWEYACRAGTTTALYTGQLTIRGKNYGLELDSIAWYGGNSGRDLEVANPFSSLGWREKQYNHSKAGTHRVKLKSPNNWGLYDTLGNVWEWCSLQQEGLLVPDPIETSSQGISGIGRVVRGGSWNHFAWGCRSAYRHALDPGDRLSNLGFRLASGQDSKPAEPMDRRGGAVAEGRSPQDQPPRSGPI